MCPTSSEKPAPSAEPLKGMRWALESSDDHWTKHDREQVRYWLSRPPAERLAQAENYRGRVFGEGPHPLKPIYKWLPSVVSSPDE